MLVYPIDNLNVWTGEIIERDEKQGRKQHEKNTTPPELQVGQYAQWVGYWIVINAYPTTPTNTMVEEKINLVNTLLDQYLESGIVYETVRYCTKLSDRVNIAETATSCLDDSLMSVTWAAADGSHTQFTASEFLTFSKAVAARSNAIKNHSCDLIVSINNAATIEDLEAIDINSDWPV
jgi:hypothetical protein